MYKTGRVQSRPINRGLPQENPRLSLVSTFYRFLKSIPSISPRFVIIPHFSFCPRHSQNPLLPFHSPLCADNVQLRAANVNDKIRLKLFISCSLQHFSFADCKNDCADKYLHSLRRPNRPRPPAGSGPGSLQKNTLGLPVYIVLRLRPFARRNLEYGTNWSDNRDPQIVRIKYQPQHASAN